MIAKAVAVRTSPDDEANALALESPAEVQNPKLGRRRRPARLRESR